MGASESTAKTNGSTEEEEERQQRLGESIAAAAAGVAAVGMAAWGISRMLSDSTDSQQKEEALKFRSAEPSYVKQQSYQKSIIPSRGFKMNTAGACHPNQGSAGGYYIGDGSVMRGPSGYGGILLDDRGKWVRDFRGFIGVSDCLTAEFHGILKGLQLMDKLGVVDSILESDSKPAVDWINEERSYPGRSEVIDEDCWEINKECKRLKMKNRITVSLCFRNDNKCAHKLANMAIDKREPYVEIMNPPAEPSYVSSSNSNRRLEGMSSKPRGYKMNTDGACRPNQGSAGGYNIGDGSVMRGPSGYGGILLDDRGKWVQGFGGFIGVSDSLTAEFHGILKGLQLMDELDVVDSILESDSKPAVDWINEERLYPRRSDVIDEDCWEIIKECKRLKNKNKVTVSFCFRNNNKCADKLASMAIDKQQPYEDIMDPPDEIKDMIVHLNQ